MRQQWPPRLRLPLFPKARSCTHRVERSRASSRRPSSQGFIGTGTTAVEEGLTLRTAFVKNAHKAVMVSDPVDAGTNTYSVDITPMKPSLKANLTGSLLAPTRVMIIATDSFGAETLVTSFDVAVNRPPVVIHDRQDVVLYHSVGTEPVASTVFIEALRWPPADGAKLNSIQYTLSRYFDDLDLDSWDATATPPAATVGDTTCSFSTSPTQPTGRTATEAAVGPPAVAAIAAAPAKVDTLALVWNGDFCDRTAKDQTTLEDVDVRSCRYSRN